MRSAAAKEAHRLRASVWYAANRDRAIASRKANADKNRDREIASRKARYWRERDSAITKAHEWAQANPDKTKRAKRNWELRNFERVRAIQAERRAKQPIGSYTHADIRRLFAIQKGLCVGCGASITKKYHIDHVIPIARGGTNWPDNLQLLCPHCNQSKSARDPFEWAQSIGRLFV